MIGAILPPMTRVRLFILGAELGALAALAYLEATDGDPVPIRLILPMCIEITDQYEDPAVALSPGRSSPRLPLAVCRSRRASAETVLILRRTTTGNDCAEDTAFAALVVVRTTANARRRLHRR